jgi:hypothetical protein
VPYIYSAMALRGRYGCQASKLLLQIPKSPILPSKRRFTTQLAQTFLRNARKDYKISLAQRRSFSSSGPVYNLTQEAPNAQAYLNSGAISGARDLVDVKKVLVIGSGGLSIGQAGEFDYSGECIVIVTCDMRLFAQKSDAHAITVLQLAPTITYNNKTNFDQVLKLSRR